MARLISERSPEQARFSPPTVVHAGASPRVLFAQLALTSAGYAQWLGALRKHAFLAAGVPAGQPITQLSPSYPRGWRVAGDGLLFGGLMIFLVKASELAAFALWFPRLSHDLAVRVAFQVLALLGGLSVWLLARLSRGVRRFTEPPVDVVEDRPLTSMVSFGQRLCLSTRRLRRQYAGLLVVVSAVGLAIAAWSVALILHGAGRFAIELGGSLAFATSFVCVNWRPWAPLGALREAEELALGATESMLIELERAKRIASPAERQDAEWKYLAQQLSALPHDRG